jgi:hypothetical protein
MLALNRSTSQLTPLAVHSERRGLRHILRIVCSHVRGAERMARRLGIWWHLGLPLRMGAMMRVCPAASAGNVSTNSLSRPSSTTGLSTSGSTSSLRVASLCLFSAIPFVLPCCVVSKCQSACSSDYAAMYRLRAASGNNVMGHLLSKWVGVRWVAPTQLLCYNNNAQRVPLAPRVLGLGRLHPAETTFYLIRIKEPTVRRAGFTTGFVTAT